MAVLDIFLFSVENSLIQVTAVNTSELQPCSAMFSLNSCFFMTFHDRWMARYGKEALKVSRTSKLWCPKEADDKAWRWRACDGYRCQLWPKQPIPESRSGHQWTKHKSRKDECTIRWMLNQFKQDRTQSQVPQVLILPSLHQGERYLNAGFKAGISFERKLEWSEVHDLATAVMLQTS